MPHPNSPTQHLLRSYFRKPARRLVRLDALLAVIGLVFIGVLLHGYRTLGESLHHDYNRLPPAEAFAYLFHRPAPADVRGLAAAGESWIGGSNVWLRFQCSPQTIRELESGAERTDPWKSGEGSLRDDPSCLIRYDVPGRLGWLQVWKLRGADYFTLGEGPGSTQFVIDHATGTVYAFYYNI